jgi:hypothetical protein
VTDGLMPFFEQKLCAVFFCKPKVNKSSLKHTTHLEGQHCGANMEVGSCDI